MAPFPALALLAEVRALEPTVEAVSVLSGPLARAGTESPEPATVVVIEVPRSRRRESRLRLHARLRQRVEAPDVRRFEQTVPGRR